MKKLKIALSLIFALTFSLFLVACGGGNKEVTDIELEGMTTEFKEGEAFTTGDLVVTVYYRGSDDPVVLEADQYEVDSSAYDPSSAGTYQIIITPEQTPAEGAQPVTATYDVTVEHSWQPVEGEEGSFECPCGAAMESLDVSDTITTVTWGNPATLEKSDNSPAVAPIAGENHVNYGVLVTGQSMTLTLKILEADASSTWFTPLMGFRNGADGVLPREDAWIIVEAAGYSTPGMTAGAAPLGTATTESVEWQVYQRGTQFGSEDMQPSGNDYATVEVTYDYSSDSIMTIRHVMTPAGGGAETELAFSVKVPKAAYEIVAYGEKCTYQVTKIESVMNTYVTGFEATVPTATVQPEGKMFDTAGITTEASMSAGDPVVNSYNAYAYIDETDAEGVVTTRRVNLATEPLVAGMYNFNVEFAGNVFYFTSDGTADGTDLITVIPSEFTAVGTSAVSKDGVVFDAPNVSFDYAVDDAEEGIVINGSGQAGMLTAKQQAALDTDASAFVAFKISSLAEGVTAVSVNGGYAALNGSVIDVVLPLGSSYTLTISAGETVVQEATIDLSAVTAPTAGAYIAESDFTLDKGGTYTVVYTGLSNVGSLQLFTGGVRDTVSEVQDAIAADGQYTALNGQLYINSVEETAEGLEVVYEVAPPQIVNLSASNAFRSVEVRDADGETLVAQTLYYNMTFSKDPTGSYAKIGDNTVVYVSRDMMYVIKGVTGESVDGNLEYTDLFIDATLNIQNKVGESFNVSVSTSADGVAPDASNTITSSVNSTGKVISLGNVGDTTDYDYGALIMYQFSVTALDLREEDVAETFYFTANEDPEGQDTYTVYKVEGNVITADVVEAASAGERVVTQEWSCVNDGIEAFKYGDTNFYFGGLVEPATGEHVWAASETENLEVCSNCGYTREYVETADGHAYITLSTPTAYEDMPNASWWVEVNGVNEVDGNFAVEYTYTHADGTGDYTNARLQLISGADTSTIDLAATADVVVVQGMLSSGDSAVISTQELLKDGVAVDKSAWLSHANGKGEFNGDVTALITRSGSVLEIKTEWTAPSGSTYVNHIVVDNFTLAPVTIQIGGYLPAVKDLNAKIGNIAATSAIDLKLGAEDNSTAYTGETPLWTGSLGVGQKITMSGTATSGGAAVWNAPLPYIWTGETAALNFRPDNWINGAADDQASVPAMSFTIAKVWKGFTPESADWVTALVDHYKQGAFDCTFVWDYTDSSVIVVDISFAWEDATFNQTYEITSTGAGLLEVYNIGLGVDCAYFNVTEMTME